jgi:hypothetical protein
VSERGRELFDRFIAQRLSHPDLRNAHIEIHVSDLLDMAEAEEIPLNEIVEEVGEISQAITDAITASRREIR